MASEVDICNLALSYLGDAATVTSINPPEGSAQAEHCARFYPIARDALLARHNWAFAMRRETLNLLSATNAQWAYVYARPNKLLKVIAIIPASSGGDYNLYIETDTLGAAPMDYAPQEFSLEVLGSGTQVILCNIPNAVVRYTEQVTDPSRFSTLFVQALSWNLASMIAGPLLKGAAGASRAQSCYAMAQTILKEAKDVDSDQHVAQPTHIVPWMQGR